ncbi:MAG: hypothetical protein GY745_19960 [Actinomycetia bacterium]|nr:hypothetical protein [Actinomycetes bacterium]MCP3910927.1 hypothetical protein [Actinomycetes bacterium]MCP4087298.1 hypothetical protein [Actinomycetes bacterium]
MPWGRRWRMLGVVDEISVVSGQVQITSRRMKPPPSEPLTLAIDGATALVRTLSLTDDGTHPVLEFEVIALSPELEQLIDASAAPPAG